ncbi:MAG: lipoate protein ligase C-terminal domain-containing protein [Candidatus Micrarchaeales archaeon]
MEGSAKQKVPGGKLVAVRLTYSDKIDSIQILGDFFLYPEDSLPEIENALKGMNIDSSEQKFTQTIIDVMAKDKIELLGVTPQSISQTIKTAVKK